MAKKKVPSVDDAIKIFKGAMQRASLSNYLYVDNTLYCKDLKDRTVLIILDQTLWLKVLDDEEMKPQLKELDINDPESRSKMNLMQYTENLESEAWVEVDPEVLFKGKIFKISLKGLEYEVPINKGLLPLKLRKAEYNNIKYRVYTKPEFVLSLKKRFDFPDVDECGFTMIRLFKII